MAKGPLRSFILSFALGCAELLAVAAGLAVAYGWLLLAHGYWGAP